MKVREFKALALAMYAANRGGRAEPEACYNFLRLLESRAVQVVIDTELVDDGFEYELSKEGE